MASNDHYEAALRREREGYLRSGKDDRVKAVDEELRRIGAVTEVKRPRKATAKPQETREG